jgi:predicted esterase
MIDGGPASIVEYVLTFFQICKPLVIGYDWGAAVALKMSIQNKDKFSKIIAFHPSYNE